MRHLLENRNRRSLSHGEYFRAELAVDNAAAPVWLSVTNLGLLLQGTNVLAAATTGHLLVPPATQTFTYDADGNQTSDGVWTNTWNAENRMMTTETLSTVPAPARRREVWSYLPDGRWSQRIVSTNNGTGYFPAFTNRYVWDGTVLLAVLDHTNGVMMTFLRGLDLSGSIQGAGGVGGVLAVSFATNGTHFDAYDGNGNVAGLVAASNATVTATYEYAAFGEVLRATGPVAGLNPIQFSTQYADEVRGTVKYLYRDYTARDGRWPSRDPIEEDGGRNLYAFSRNDNINFYDVLGLSWKIERKRGDRAHAKPESGDTVADLAKLIGFDDKDFRKWLKPVGPSRMPSSATEKITDCAQFTIPNTVFIEFGQMFKQFDLYGQIPNWRWDLLQLGKTLDGNGFNVVKRIPSDPATAKADLMSPNIHGFAYAGHGGGEDGKSVGVLVFKDGEGSDTALDGARYTQFGISFLYAYGCATAFQKPQTGVFQKKLGGIYSPWEINVSTRGTFWGMWGDILGWPWSTTYGNKVENELCTPTIAREVP